MLPLPGVLSFNSLKHFIFLENKEPERAKDENRNPVFIV